MAEQQDPAHEPDEAAETEESGAGYGNNAGEQGVDADAGAGDVEDET